MKVKTLNGILKLTNRISNGSSLTPLYRSVEIGQNSVKACSEYGNIHIVVEGEDTGVASATLLDHDSLLAITSSLPQNEDITFVEKENNVAWACGRAKGSLNHVNSDHNVPAISHQDFPWVAPPELANALLLSSCACQAAAVSIGLYGISIEPVNGHLHMVSSNSISLASTRIEKGTYPEGKKITIRPPVPGIVAALITACPNCQIDIDENGLYIIGDWLMAHLPLGQPLEHDLLALSQRFEEKKEIAQINSSAVKKFVTRARNLTEKKQTFNVTMKIEEGKLILLHEGIGASSEEFFLCEGIDPNLKYDSVTLPGDLLLLPMEFCQYAVFDYLKESQLILRGDSPDFVYVLSGGNS